MTPEELKAIKERADAATPGPWEFQSGTAPNGDPCDLLVAEIGPTRPDEEPEYAEVLFRSDLSESEISANWEFIQHARTDIPALLSAIEERDKRIADHKDEIAAVEDALGYAGVWHNVECEAKTHAEAIEMLSARANESESENATLRGYIARLVEALAKIQDYEPVPFDWTPEEWAKHTPETCDECRYWKDLKHPLQHSCDGWYRMLHERDRRNKDARAGVGWKCKSIARDALTPEVRKIAEEHRG